MPSEPEPGGLRSLVLVVGASRGIGLGLVRAYADAGWRVHATTREPEAPGALGEVPGDVVLHGFDVRDAPEALLDAVGDKAIDLLVHNAGVSGRGAKRDEVMQVNGEAPIRVAEAFLDLIAKSRERKLVLMTSQLGARRGGRGSLGPYGESKAALNDRFRERAPAWAERGISAIVMHPGWVRTDMGGRNASLSVEESVAGMRLVFDGLGPGQHGRFLTWEGEEHPW